LIRGVPNIKVQSAQSREQVEALYEWADMVVVPLKSNLHVSGVSVILEATTSGLPVISSDTGGLRAYFSSEEVHYVPVGDSIGMRWAARTLAEDDDQRFRLATAAQRRVVEAGLTSDGYALRHRLLSQALVNGDRLRMPFSFGEQRPGSKSAEQAPPRSM
jgi:glycosyltransferase involved in cell wall biosynthesis